MPSTQPRWTLLHWAPLHPHPTTTDTGHDSRPNVQAPGHWSGVDRAQVRVLGHCQAQHIPHCHEEAHLRRDCIQEYEEKHHLELHSIHLVR